MQGARQWIGAIVWVPHRDFFFKREAVAWLGRDPVHTHSISASNEAKSKAQFVSIGSSWTRRKAAQRKAAQHGW